MMSQCKISTFFMCILLFSLSTSINEYFIEIRITVHVVWMTNKRIHLVHNFMWCDQLKLSYFTQCKIFYLPMFIYKKPVTVIDKNLKWLHVVSLQYKYKGMNL